VTSNTGFSMQPLEVSHAAAQLDVLADRIDRVTKNEAPNLTVVASGGDEVSQRVASTLNDVHSDFIRSSDRGSNEVREVAATLRAHTNRVIDAELGFAV
jgi:phage-related protein